MNKLEQAILDIIEKRYKHKYIGGIKVTKLGTEPEGYKLVLDLGNPDKRVIQISISTQLKWMKNRFTMIIMTSLIGSIVMWF